MKTKKAVFFTLLSVIIVAVIFALMSHRQYSFDTTQPTNLRISTLDNFMGEMQHSYIPLSLRLSGKEAIDKIILHMNQTDSYLSNPYTEIGDVMLNGRLGANLLLENHTVSNFTKRAEQIAKEAYDLELDISIISIELNQSSPWEIDIRARTNIVGSAEVAQWSLFDTHIETTMSIIGFHDPLYVTNISNGLYNNKIYPSTLNPKQWNSSHVDALIGSGNYTRFENTLAPHYLSRFTRNYEASTCCGIVSLVNPQRLSEVAGITDFNESFADFQFFNNSLSCGRLFDISLEDPQHQDFKLGFDYAIKFNVSEEATPLIC